MPDFYQHRAVTTLHRLGQRDFDELHGELVGYGLSRPLTLVMPALYSEAEGPALPAIVEQLSAVGFIDEVIVSMNRMDGVGFRRARELFDLLPQSHAVIWNDGPKLAAVYDRLRAFGVDGYRPGKGCNVWLACGYAIAKGGAAAIVVHDSDILSYDRGMLARLCLPALHPELRYDFCKSYYGRVNGRMYGRVTRLFVIPLLRALIEVCGRSPLLEFLEEFRYPLSGEFVISTELASRVAMPGDWGLEVGLLGEVYRGTSAERICQVALGSNFDHKHQELGLPAEDQGPAEGQGLQRMAAEIAASLFADARDEGLRLCPSSLAQVGRAYTEIAEGLIRRYHHDSIANGLLYSGVDEHAAVEVFSRVLGRVARQVTKDEEAPRPKLPPWGEVLRRDPAIGDELIEAVRQDNRALD